MQFRELLVSQVPFPKKKKKEQKISYPYSINPSVQNHQLTSFSQRSLNPSRSRNHYNEFRPFITLNKAFAPAFLPPYPVAMIPPESNPSQHPRRPHGPRHTVQSRTGERRSRYRGRFLPRRNCVTVCQNESDGFVRQDGSAPAVMRTPPRPVRGRGNRVRSRDLRVLGRLGRPTHFMPTHMRAPRPNGTRNFSRWVTFSGGPSQRSGLKTEG